jgi:hypothetical protein
MITGAAAGGAAFGAQLAASTESNEIIRTQAHFFICLFIIC